MFAKLTTKIALRKAGIPSNTFSYPQSASTSSSKDANSSSELVPFANPFANLSVPKSWSSWATPVPPPIEVTKPPVLGNRAPPTGGKFRLGGGVGDRGGGDGRCSLVVFLRWAGCPFAEKTFIELRKLANRYPNLHCVAVSHCTKAATDKWISALGGAWAVEVIVDEEREMYASWGLGVSTAYYLLNPWTQMAARKLGREEGIWGRECGEGGNRWQIGGAWAVDQKGILRWGEAAKTADELMGLEEGIKIMGVR